MSLFIENKHNKEFICPWSHVLLAWKWVEIDRSTCHPERKFSAKMMKTYQFWPPSHSKQKFSQYNDIYQVLAKILTYSNKAKLVIGSLILSPDILHSIWNMLFSTYRLKWKLNHPPRSRAVPRFAFAIPNSTKRHLVNAGWPPWCINTEIITLKLFKFCKTLFALNKILTMVTLAAYLQGEGYIETLKTEKILKHYKIPMRLKNWRLAE